jgi:hypothetical protein
VTGFLSNVTTLHAERFRDTKPAIETKRHKSTVLRGKPQSGLYDLWGGVKVQAEPR